MPKTNRETRLKDKDGTFIAFVSKGVLVEIIGPPKDDSVIVKVPTEPGAPTGFLLKAHVDDEDPAPAPIDKSAFARECAFQESAFGVSGHYLAAIAQLRSDIVDGKSADGFGLYRLLMEEWKADWNTKEFEFTFAEEDIHQWRNQCTLFALMARRALDAYVAAFTTRPNAIELYLTQMIGVDALRLMKNDAAMTVKAALTTVGPGKMPPGAPEPDKLIDRFASVLKSGAGPAQLQQASAQAEVALNAALLTTKGLFAAAPSAKKLEAASNEMPAGTAGGQPVVASDDLKNFHHVFEDLGGVRWKLTSSGLLVEGEPAPAGSGGAPTTVTNIWTRWQNEITDAAKEFGVPIELIIATIGTESSGREDAERSEPHIGDMSVGLMQTLIGTARGESAKLGVSKDTITRDWLRVGKNSIRAGTSYMATQKARTRYDPPVVACAYNAGSVFRQDGANNRWKMRQFPIGTAEHANRFVQFFNDCFLLFTDPAALPDPSYAKTLKA